MIYYEEYKIKFYKDSATEREPVMEYLKNIEEKHRSKISKYIELLRAKDGYLDEPISKHIYRKIRELRVDFSNNY